MIVSPTAYGQSASSACHDSDKPCLLQVALHDTEAPESTLQTPVQDLRSSREDQAVELQERETRLQQAQEERASVDQQLADITDPPSS